MLKLKKAFDTPWKVANELQRWMVYPHIRLLFAFNRIQWGKNWRFYGIPIIQKHRGSQMVFGPALQLRSNLRSNPLGPNHPVILSTWDAGSHLEVGTNFAMTGGSICTTERITIGDYVTVGANTTIIDTDFHPLDPEIRRLHPQDAQSAPIHIESDVFIGMNCLILKGAHLGRGCVIGAGSVITRDVPPGMMAAGNPAQVIHRK